MKKKPDIFLRVTMGIIAAVFVVTAGYLMWALSHDEWEKEQCMSRRAHRPFGPVVLRDREMKEKRIPLTMQVHECPHCSSWGAWRYQRGPRRVYVCLACQAAWLPEDVPPKEVVRYLPYF